MGQLDEMLWDWGGYFREGRPPIEDRSLTGNSSISRFGKPKKRKGVKLTRDGRSRRAMMGAAAGLPKGRLLPEWGADPCAGSPTRVAKPQGIDDPRETPAVLQVQAAWIALYRQQEDQAQVIRCHYQVRGRVPEERLQAASKQIGRILTYRQYRHLLEMGREWLHTRLGLAISRDLG